MTPPAVTSHPSNAESARAWDVREGHNWIAHEAFFDRAMAAAHERLLAAAAVRPADRVLDIGCGNGQTTRDVARRAPAGAVLGIDLSLLMLERARRRAAEDGLTNVDFVHGDAAIHPFTVGGYDLVVSRMGVMFFGEPVPAFANLARALRPGGRLAVAVWQDLAHNEWLREITRAVLAGRPLPDGAPDDRGPTAFGDPERVQDILAAAGFADVAFAPVDSEMDFGADVEAAFTVVAGQVRTSLQQADEPTRARAVRALRDTLTAHDTGHGVRFQSAAWIVTARLSQG